MGSRMGAVGTAGDQATNAWIRKVPMVQIAKRIGISELPMRQPDFNFYAHAVHHLKQMGFKGQDQDLYDTAYDVIQTLFINLGERAKTVEGPIYHYVKWYNDHIKEGVKPEPFDEYFQYAFRQKAITALKQKGIRKKRGLSIEYGRGDDDEGTLGEEFLEHAGPGPEAISSEREEIVKREEVFKEIPEMIAKSNLRHGDKYVAVWDMMRKGYKLQEMATELNARGISSLSGGQWGTGPVHRVRNYILNLVKGFLEERGVDWESIVASRKGFRFGLDPEG